MLSAHKMRAYTSQIEKIRDMVSNLTLNDASKAFNGLEEIANATHIFNCTWFAEIRSDELADAVVELEQAASDAMFSAMAMIDDGWADDGFEDLVFEKMEEDILPELEGAIRDFLWALHNEEQKKWALHNAKQDA